MRIRLPLLLCLFAVSPSFGSQLVDNLRAGKDQTVVVYGTSLTAGGRWVTETKVWLDKINPQAKVTMVNSGQSGKNSIVGLAKLDAVVIGKKPDTVLIEFAVNDAFLFPEKERQVSLEQSGRNLETMIERIKKALPGTEIVLQTMNPAWDASNGRGSGSKRPELDAYYEGYRKVAARHGLLLIDHHKNWMKLSTEDKALFEKYVSDGVHPTPEASSKVTFPQVKASLDEK